MSRRGEFCTFSFALAILIALFLADCLFGGKVLSAADTLLATEAFSDSRPEGFEPANKLLIDSALQFQPWLEFNKAMIRSGKLPLWNSAVGCGAPHLANGQSAVFDPFHLIAYLGPLPQAFGWMAAARLWIAGLGAYVLASRWGLGGLGRWFAGLSYPFCGFLVVWLLFPVTSAAVWLPWMIWATDRILEKPSSERVAELALVSGLVLFAGHIQTSAHVLMASACYFVWRVQPTKGSTSPRTPALYALGLALGIGVAAVEVIPLGFYLSKSRVWNDRSQERANFATITEPKIKDMLCTAIPYLYGSQRKGDPNLARPLGVRNLNEAAGGYAGLACLVVLAPSAWLWSKHASRSRFLGWFTLFGLLAAFDIPPIPNLLRIVPVVNVIDQRRWTLWVAFGLVMLGSIGLEAIAQGIGRKRRSVLGKALVLAALAAAAALPFVERTRPLVRRTIEASFMEKTLPESGASSAGFASAAFLDRKVDIVMTFLRRILFMESALLLGVGFTAWSAAIAKTQSSRTAIACGLISLNVCDLFLFGFGMNPAIAPDLYLPESKLINELRRTVGSEGRILGIGAELPPNTLSRYGLKDPRNYDSIELDRLGRWFDELYEPSRGDHSSRRTISWKGVSRARWILESSGVRAVVSSTPPPNIEGFESVRKIGRCWAAFLQSEPLVRLPADSRGIQVDFGNGKIVARRRSGGPGDVVLLETFDSGWRAKVDGNPSSIKPFRQTFMKVRLDAKAREIELVYDPIEMRIACACSLAALFATGSLWVGGPIVLGVKKIVSGLGTS